MRFVHTADWQLGKLFGRFGPEVRNALADARFDSGDAIEAFAVNIPTMPGSTS
ncbi:MAG: metallophosphoesterase [Xanthobacteraceae bacterium]|jgi:DNA repair exonuclease SbcCD nuclease subunit|nr:metallophosphoesterase [Xanthobacteraceae bacterium]